MTAPEGRRLWVLSVPMALLVLFVYFWNLGSYGLIDPDEGRYSEIPREMLESGDFVTPRLNYVKYFEKPALHYWLTAGAFSLLGPSEFAARLVPALCGLGGCLLTFLLARRMTGSARAGGYSALVLAGTLLWFGVSRLNIIDMTLSFFFTAALFGYGMWLSDGDRPRGSPWLLLFYAGMALATLSKGLVGVVLPGGIAVLHLLFARRWWDLPRIFPLLGIALYFALTAPWFWAVCRANPDFFDFFFIREHLLRYLTRVHGRHEPFWFFVPILLAALVPWTGMLLEALHAARGKWGLLPRSSGLFLGVWFAVPFLFFSLSSSKLIPYIAPCMPPLAILIGTALEILSRGRPRVLVLALETVLTGVRASIEDMERASGQSGQQASTLLTIRFGILARLVADMIGPEACAGLYLTGGDVMINSCLTLGAKGITLVDYVIPQIDQGRISGGPYDGVPIVCKGGLTGSTDTAVLSVNRLFDERKISQ